MGNRPYRGAIDHERLGHHLRVLGVPTRILLLQKLQWPKVPSEIELPAFRKDRGLRADRALSRQVVELHLKKLEEVGFVRSQPTERGGHAAREYLVDPARLFTLADDLRRLSLLRPAHGSTAWGTGAAGTVEGTEEVEPPRLPDGPAMLLVAGPAEGTAYPLQGPGPWVIGRSKGAAVSVPYDPYVSGENAEVWRDGTRYFVRDLPSSSNGTTHNWRVLPKGERAELVPGDTVGAGRTLLVFRNR